MERPPAFEEHVLKVCLVDANVLYSRVLRDYLLYSARARLISIAWSSRILGEMTGHLMLNRPGFTQDSADRLVRAMNAAFPYAERNPAPEHFASFEAIGLPDEDDRHVIAAALASEATVICTHNISDFPQDVMAKLGLIVMTPDALLRALISEHQLSMLWVHATSVDSLPGATDASTIRALRSAGAPESADLVAQILGIQVN